MDPSVLYNRLISIQSLIENVEGSTINHISWPLVSYCNDLWDSFFGLSGPRIFYTLTHEHNYYISPFSSQLATLLSDILPSVDIDNIIGNRKLYCLHLSSLEETNLPLYANIAHEFGHPLYNIHRDDFFNIWDKRFNDIHNNIFTLLETLDKGQAPRLMVRIKAITLSIAKELLADLFAALVMGPAFFLSLFEMSWGGNSSTWPILLSPISYNITAYPSFNFRLKCIRDFINIGKFEEDAKKEFSKINDTRLQKVSSVFSKIAITDETERFLARPESDYDRPTIIGVLNEIMDKLKDSYNLFLENCNGLINREYKDKLSSLNLHNISELLIRLENDILPNIIPDGTLLGNPAEFQTILNSSALYRLNILLEETNHEAIEKVSRNIEKIERLTAKALEVSYVQRKFSLRDVER